MKREAQSNIPATAPPTSRLSQADILEAVNLLLRQRGLIPEGAGYGMLRWKFGIIGDPLMTVIGEPPPQVGQVYVDWSFEPTPNVVGLRTRST